MIRPLTATLTPEQMYERWFGRGASCNRASIIADLRAHEKLLRERTMDEFGILYGEAAQQMNEIMNQPARIAPAVQEEIDRKRALAPEPAPNDRAHPPDKQEST